MANHAGTACRQELDSEEGGKVAQNVIVGVAGILIPVLWFGMDFQNAAGKEVAALQSRQQNLATLAEQVRGHCTASNTDVANLHRHLRLRQ
jgi:hypothetical protein